MRKDLFVCDFFIYAMVFMILIVIALLVCIFAVLKQSQTDDISQYAMAINAEPSFTSIMTATESGGIDISTFSVAENSTASLYVHGVAEDPNGCFTIASISNWTMALFRTNVVGTSACSADNNNCFQNIENTNTALTNCTGAGDLNINYQARYLDMPYYTDPTDTGSPNPTSNWSSYVKVSDGTFSAETTDMWEFSSTIALDVTSSVNYGMVSLNAVSSEQTLVFTNTGNRNIDADQSASGSMSCTGSGSGTISASQAHYSFNTGFAWSAGTAFTIAATNFDMNLLQRTNDSSVSVKTVYLLLTMPSTGVSGTCSNTITFTAKADA